MSDKVDSSRKEYQRLTPARRAALPNCGDDEPPTPPPTRSGPSGHYSESETEDAAAAHRRNLTGADQPINNDRDIRDMNEALCSILCGEDRWNFHMEDNRTIKFNKDGTGELWCCVNFCWFIALELEWKSLSPPQPDQVVETASATRTRSPHLLGQLNLEITLTKRLAQGVDPSMMRQSTILNEHGLSDDAFRAKSFTVKIEKGNFTEPIWVGSKGSYRPRYALRLLFDKSPYPPREEWTKPEGGQRVIIFGIMWNSSGDISRSWRRKEKP